jgi:RNA polymerase sigma factor (sigma-70 family)
MSDIPQLVDHLFRRQAGQMVATLTRALGARHLALVEEVVQDALVTALQQWPFRGVPDQPAAWLFQVARNRALDRLRRDRTSVQKAPDVAREQTAAEQLSHVEAVLSCEDPPIADDQLGMMFMTCHPVLPRESRVALTLKIVGGFSVGEIARAFLTQESTVAQRLVRAKRLLRDRNVEFEMPDREEMADRLDSVLEAIYLIFNEGHTASSGDRLIREDIAGEAIRLAMLLTAHPRGDVPRAWALVALLLLHAARFPARMADDGTLFVLRDQDRGLWDRQLVVAGLRALDRASTGPAVSQYHIEAGIAACHAAAPSWEATDWPQILSLYDALSNLSDSPVVGLNRAIALSRVRGPQAGIEAIEQIAGHPALARYHLLPAALAELWREAGNSERAAACYRDALALAILPAERRFLTSRLDGL